MNPSQPTPPRRRLQELLAIPDSQRTDEQWDELNELEIKLAPGNRESSSDGNVSREGREGNAPQGRPGQQRNNGQSKRPRKFHKRPPKVGGPGGGNNAP